MRSSTSLLLLRNVCVEDLREKAPLNWAQCKFLACSIGFSLIFFSPVILILMWHRLSNITLTRSKQGYGITVCIECFKYSCIGDWYRGRFIPMLEKSNYYCSTSGHLCNLDHCTLRTSLKLHTFGRRFYDCHYWSPVSTTSIISKHWLCALSHQFVETLFKCFIWLYRVMTVHVSSSNGWTPTLARVAQP